MVVEERWAELLCTLRYRGRDGALRSAPCRPCAFVNTAEWRTRLLVQYLAAMASGLSELRGIRYGAPLISRARSARIAGSLVGGRGYEAHNR